MKREASITELQKGQHGVVLRIENQHIAQKLFCMGMMPGEDVFIVRTAPFYGAYYLKVGNHRIVVRDNEASAIIVSCDI
jgi:Fe2+ transport system protein FeoA